MGARRTPGKVPSDPTVLRTTLNIATAYNGVSPLTEPLPVLAGRRWLPPDSDHHLTKVSDSLSQLRLHTWRHLDAAALGSLLRTNGVWVGTVWFRAAGKMVEWSLRSR